MLLELIVQSLLGLVAVYSSLILLGSGKLWKRALGVVLMAAGLVFTLTSGEILISLMNHVPSSGAVKTFLVPFLPYAIIASFIAWLGYVLYAFITRWGIMGALWDGAMIRKERGSDHLETAKSNALTNQLFWLMVSLLVSVVALLLSVSLWFNMELFQSRMGLVIIALVWVFLVPPLVIHTSLAKPEEIRALRNLTDLKGVKAERVEDYRELLAVMDDIKDEGLRQKLDDLIIEGLSEALIRKR